MNAPEVRVRDLARYAGVSDRHRSVSQQAGAQALLRVARGISHPGPAEHDATAFVAGKGRLQGRTLRLAMAKGNAGSRAQAEQRPACDAASGQRLRNMAAENHEGRGHVTRVRYQRPWRGPRTTGKSSHVVTSWLYQSRAVTRP